LRPDPCSVAIDLFCRGLAVDGSCDLEHDARGLSRTRAGLGSGLDLVLEGAPPLHRPVWLNAPLVEGFVAGTPWRLEKRDGRYSVVESGSGERFAARVPAEPAWYRQHTTSGLEMQQVGVLQGTYLGVYVGPVCRFWRAEEDLHCRFCTTGLNVDPMLQKSVRDVVETARAAREGSGVTFVHLNTGYQQGAAIRLMEPYVRALKDEVGVLVGVQAAPEAPLTEFDRLIDLGVDHLSFCLEYYDPGWFASLCPGKQAAMGQKAFLDTLAHCQSRMPKGACSGEIVAGNEPIDATMAAIDHITSLGAFPTVCIFRPLAGSDMEGEPSPEPVAMRAVMRHMWESCRDHGVPIGLAPNIEVSLVIQPNDAAYLADGTWRDRVYLWRNALLRRLARPLFRKRMRARQATPKPTPARGS